MIAPYSWIKEFLDIDIPAEKVAEKLNETGIETVVHKFGEYIPNIETVKIIDVKKHPEKDKLYICTVSDGESEYQVITGADNIKKGYVVILAKVGAVIKGREIKPVKFGSYESQGMLLSLEELGLEENSEGIFLLGTDVPVGKDANDILSLGKDYLFEIEITPNRGDALSIRGLSREIGAIFGIERKEPLPLISIFEEENIGIEILTDKVWRYRGVVVKGIEVKESPFDIKLKLIKSGQKPINNIVDITNYILLQEGQPLHAFDLDKIKGKVIIRHSNDGEKITTLDGEEVELKPTDIVISDEEKAIAIAGVIGGENTKIDENTKNILLEAAVFDNVSVRKTAKRLAISTESSYRFERGVDIENLANAQDKALELIIKVAGGKIVGEKDIYIKPYQPKIITLKEKTIDRILGIPILKEEARDILNRLEIKTEISDDGVVSTIPAFRAFDLEREVDLVEEVGRIKGFDNLTPEFPEISLQSFKRSEEFSFEVRARDFFKDNGLTEVVNYTFVGEGIYDLLDLPVPEIKIENYLLKTQSVMRDNLAVSLIGTLQENVKFQQKDLSIFEISSVFFKDFEEIRVGILVSGKYIQGYNYKKGDLLFSTTEEWNFLKLKGIVESYFKSVGLYNTDYISSKLKYLHPYQSADIFINGIKVGYIGKIHPKKAEILEIPKNTFIAELKLRYVPRNIDEDNLKEGYLFTLFKEKDNITFSELPKYPAVKRDLAFIIDENLEVDKLISAVKESNELIEDVKLFDVYFMEDGKKSVAMSVVFRHKERSLSDKEINEVVEGLVEKLKERFTELTLRM